MANENADDLKIKIPLTPSQNTSFPALVEKLNSDSEMQMSPIALSNGFLEISCHDLSDLLEQLKSSTPLEYHRFKKQAESALQAIILASDEKPHQKKNFVTALKTIQIE